MGFAKIKEIFESAPSAGAIKNNSGGGRKKHAHKHGASLPTKNKNMFNKILVMAIALMGAVVNANAQRDTVKVVNLGSQLHEYALQSHKDKAEQLVQQRKDQLLMEVAGEEFLVAERDKKGPYVEARVGAYMYDGTGLPTAGLGVGYERRWWGFGASFTGTSEAYDRGSDIHGHFYALDVDMSAKADLLALGKKATNGQWRLWAHAGLTLRTHADGHTVSAENEMGTLTQSFHFKGATCGYRGGIQGEFRPFLGRWGFFLDASVGNQQRYTVVGTKRGVEFSVTGGVKFALGKTWVHRSMKDQGVKVRDLKKGNVTPEQIQEFLKEQLAK